MDHIKDKLKRLENNYKYSTRIYNKYYNYINIPSIVITNLSSLISYLNTSELMPDNYRTYFTVAAMLQTINTSCEFNIKKVKFREAANDIDLLIDKVFFEMENPNEKNFIDHIEKIKNNCKFLPLEYNDQKVI